MSKSAPSLPWYKEGLRFSCTQCGKCCTGEPGAVWLTEEEMVEMANFLKLSLSTFKRLYVKRRDNRYLLIEKKSANGHDCIFYQNHKCLVYQARPAQCRTYPFWKENLLSPKSWEQAAAYCEGIRSDAPSVSAEEIDKILEPQNPNEHYVSHTSDE